MKAGSIVYLAMVCNQDLIRNQDIAYQGFVLLVP
jgi:hypothetical protein